MEKKFVTSAYANKLLKSLDEDKKYWLNQEATCCTYTAAVGEEPVVPEYDYKQVSEKIDGIDEQICQIKHALNVSNAAARIEVCGKTMSVDEILVRMAQLNKRKGVLDEMRKKQEKERIQQYPMSARNGAPEYRYANYRIADAKADYEAVSKDIMDMQMALDYYNQTAQFEIEE